MNPGLFRSSALAMAALLAACGDGGSSAADNTAAFTAAADALAAKLQSGPPAANDPAVTAFEAQTNQGLTTLGTPALPLRGFDSYDDLCGKTANIVASYVNAGGAADPAAMERNVVQYLDQIFTPLLFSAHCSAAHIPFVAEQTADDVAGNSAALQQIRSGVIGQFSGLLQMAGDPALGDPRRHKIIEQLGNDAPKFAIILGQPQRQQLSGLIDAVRATLPAGEQAGADRIKAAVGSAECGPLCTM